MTPLLSDFLPLLEQNPKLFPEDPARCAPACPALLGLEASLASMAASGVFLPQALCTCCSLPTRLLLPRFIRVSTGSSATLPTPQPRDPFSEQPPPIAPQPLPCFTFLQGIYPDLTFHFLIACLSRENVSAVEAGTISVFLPLHP